MRIIHILFYIFLSTLAGAQQMITVTSPNGTLTYSFQILQGKAAYAISYKKIDIITKSAHIALISHISHVAAVDK